MDRIRDGYEPEKILLFASLAWRGDTREWKDIDRLLACWNGAIARRDTILRLHRGHGAASTPYLPGE